MNWVVPRMWEDEDVWILGGGPSVVKQFKIPDELVRSVMDRTSPPSVYSPYMEFLHKKHVIGINIAFMIGPWMDIVFFGDNGFFMRYKSDLATYPGLRVTCSRLESSRGVPWVKALDKDEHSRGISSNPAKVSWNGNSGAAAISVAANAGAKRIFLLGFDMKLSTDKRQHWHDVYQRGVIDTEEKLMKIPFERFLSGFEQIAKDAKTRNIEIINVSPDSEIKVFPRIHLQDII